MTKVVTLVPWRATDKRSIVTFEFVHQHLKSFEYPIFLGEPNGKYWNRSEAINNAAKAAGSWTVAIIADADTLHLHTSAIHAAVDICLNDANAAVIPWDERWRYNAQCSDKAMSGYEHSSLECLDEQDGFSHNDSIKHYPWWKVGSTIVLSRGIWERVGGFDEGFKGWGYEDCANRMAIETLGRAERLSGTIIHLWHPHDTSKGPGNRGRFLAYQQAHMKKDKMIRTLKHYGLRPKIETQ